MPIDWTRGYECTWRLAKVDAATWADVGALSGVTSASYSSDAGSDSVETVSVEVAGAYDADAPESRWYRLEGLCEQGAETALVTVATLRMAPEKSEWAGGMRTDTMRGASGLADAGSAAALPDGAWAARWSDGAARAGSLVAGCTDAPVIVDGSFALSKPVVFDLDSTPLDAALVLLDGSEWVLRPDETGRVHVMQLPLVPTATFGTAERGMFLSTASRDADGAVTYTRAWGPGLRVHDMFRAYLPEIGLNGTYRVTKQEVECAASITVEETAEEVL